jgi:hypothetical protein
VVMHPFELGPPPSSLLFLSHSCFPGAPNKALSHKLLPQDLRSQGKIVMLF